MNTNFERARELLAIEYEESGCKGVAMHLRAKDFVASSGDESVALRAIARALSQSQQGRGLPDLPDDFSSSKDWRHGNYAERVEWLMVMVRSLGEQLDAVGAALAAQPVFANAGDSEEQFIADGERLNCPACGGSGHVDDAQPGAGDVLQSEAVFAFAASLTCRPGVMEIGSTSDAAPMAELAAAFCEKYGFDPCRDHFPKMLTAAQGGGDGS